jgi:hypothetical protein
MRVMDQIIRTGICAIGKVAGFALAVTILPSALAAQEAPPEDLEYYEEDPPCFIGGARSAGDQATEDTADDAKLATLPVVYEDETPVQEKPAQD